MRSGGAGSGGSNRGGDSTDVPQGFLDDSGPFAGRRVPVREGHDVATPSRVLSEDAVETDERMTRGRAEGAKSRQKLNVPT